MSGQTESEMRGPRHHALARSPGLLSLETFTVCKDDDGA